MLTAEENKNKNVNDNKILSISSPIQALIPLPNNQISSIYSTSSVISKKSEPKT